MRVKRKGVIKGGLLRESAYINMTMDMRTKLYLLYLKLHEILIKNNLFYLQKLSQKNCYTNHQYGRVAVL